MDNEVSLEQDHDETADLIVSAPDVETKVSTVNSLTVSDNGLAFIKENEGFRSHAYPDPATGANPWTIGYGCTHDVHEGMEVDEAEAELMLREHLVPVEHAINHLVEVELTQAQFDALADFVFNVGTGAFKESHLLKVLNEGQYTAVELELMKWTKAGGVSMKGLMLRRQHERDLFTANY